MKHFIVASAFVLIGIWDYFQWRWQYGAGIDAFHLTLLPPTIGALWMGVAPLLRSSAGGWTWAARVLAGAGAVVALRLAVESGSRGDMASLSRECLLLALALATFFFRNIQKNS